MNGARGDVTFGFSFVSFVGERSNLRGISEIPDPTIFRALPFLVPTAILNPTAEHLTRHFRETTLPSPGRKLGDTE